MDGSLLWSPEKHQAVRKEARRKRRKRRGRLAKEGENKTTRREKLLAIEKPNECSNGGDKSCWWGAW